MLYTVCFVVRVFVLFCLPHHFHVIMSGSSEDGSNRDMETRGAVFEVSHGSSRSMIKKVLLYLVLRFSLYVDHRRVIFFPA